MILRRARSEGRVVLTHDGDFGALAVHAGEPIVGIVRVRPGHIRAQVVIDVLAAFETREVEAEPPFVAVVESRGDSVRIRVRELGVRKE